MQISIVVARSSTRLSWHSLVAILIPLIVNIAIPVLGWH